jgi:hypothetical protein
MARFFEMKDGSKLLVRATLTSSEARDLAASAGASARVFGHISIFDYTVCEAATIIHGRYVAHHTQ